MTDPAISVRVAAGADVPAMAGLRRAFSAEGHPGLGDADDPGYPARFAAWFERESSRRRTWLAEEAGQAVGMVNLTVFERMPRPGPHPGRWGYLGNLYVRPESRGRGAGAALVAAVLAYADAQDLVRVVLSPSERSVPLYRRAGFGPAGALLLRPRPAR